MWKRSKALSFDTLYTTVMPFLSLFVRFNILILIILFPVYIVAYLIMIALMGALRSVYMFLNNGWDGVYGIAYSFLHEILIYWALFAAIATIKDTGWGTR